MKSLKLTKDQILVIHAEGEYFIIRYVAIIVCRAAMNTTFWYPDLVILMGEYWIFVNTKDILNFAIGI